MNESTTTSGTGPGRDLVAHTLRPLLARQRAALRAHFFWHGCLLTLAFVAAATLLFFALDRWLLLPTPIRLFHTAAVGTLCALCAIRFLRYPLSRTFGDVDLAVWFERTFPELHQRLVSAIQLHALPAGELRNQSQPMIDQLLVETTAAVQALPLQRLFDRRPTNRAGGGAAALLLALGAIAIWSPATMRAFLLRHLGIAASYPRQTTLQLELPPPGPDLQRTDRDGAIDIVLPAGADLHVTVLALGTVPPEVFLDVQSLGDAGAGEERAIAMMPRPGDRFRHVFRRLSSNFQFHARGGDDDAGDRIVTVRTVYPPQVANLVATVRPPAYTGVAALEQKGGAIEALIGSEVELVAATTIAVRTATMVFLESGRRLELVPTTPIDDSGVAAAWRTRFLIEASDRYQVDLVADNGLRNPAPGTYPIAALQDYAPIGRWLLPEDEGLVLLPTAMLCLRLEARDDFGLQAVELVIQTGGNAGPSRALLPAGGQPLAYAVLTEVLEVKDLMPAKAAGNDGLLLRAALRDNKQPVAGLTELPPRIVQIVDEAQLTATIARLFRSLRQELQQALEVQVDRRLALEELTARTEVGGTEQAQALTGIEVGQGRVASTVDRVHRGLMRAFDLHLWNKLEPSQNAAQVVAAYRDHARALREPLALDPTFYRDVAARRAAGTLGALEQCLDPILAMIGLADQVGSVEAPAVARSLAEAQVARGASDRSALATSAIAGQKRIETALGALLLRLEEWNDFQDMVQEVRALRDGQRDVTIRTEEARGKK